MDIRKASDFEVVVPPSAGLDCAVMQDDEPRFRTKQSFKDECDINTIVRRFGLSGELPQGLVMPTYQDFEGIFDFQSAMDALNDATDRFMQLPAHVRARFENSPHKFVEFCSDERNRDEAIGLGLVPKPVVVPAVPVPGAAPAAPAAAVVAAPAAPAQ